jgi:hypothetical protein
VLSAEALPTDLPPKAIPELNLLEMVRIQALAQQSCFPFADAAKDDLIR